MARVLLTTILLLSLLSGLTQAATQEAECYGGQITGDTFSLEDAPRPIYQGSFRGLLFNCGYGEGICEAEGWENLDKFAQHLPGPGYKMAQCVYSGIYHCGDASLDTQLCWSENPFTLANTSNGETCVSTLDPLGVTARRGLTLYGISIDRSGAETTYCQIEFKTLARGEEVPTTPPGTGSTKVIGLAPGDPDTDQTPDGPTIPFPSFPVFQTAVPFMPHFLLIGMTVLLATLGVRSVRRRKTA